MIDHLRTEGGDDTTLVTMAWSGTHQISDFSVYPLRENKVKIIANQVPSSMMLSEPQR